ncbi:MAG: hypothetical protein R2741_01400 [Methanolobus sp.]
MVKLTDAMKEEFAKMKIFPLATASKRWCSKRNPNRNVLPSGRCRNTYGSVDNFFSR